MDILERYANEMAEKFGLSSREKCIEFVKKVVDESHEFYQMRIKQLAKENMKMREVLMDICAFMETSGVKKKAK